MAQGSHATRSGAMVAIAATLAAACLLGLATIIFRMTIHLPPWLTLALVVSLGATLCGTVAFLGGHRCARLNHGIESRQLERTRLEDALIGAEERYQRLFELSSDAMALIDAENGEVVECNEAACASLGYRREDMERSRLYRIEADQDACRFPRHAAHARQKGHAAFGLRARTRTGEIRDLSLKLHRMDMHGKDFLLTSWHDVTEQNVMRERIFDQYQLLNTLIQTIPCPLFYKDTAGRYTGCNRAFEAFLGRPREEIVGKSVFDLAPREIAEEYFRRDRELFTHPGQQVYEWQAKTPDGVRDVVFHKATFSDAEGRVAGLIGVILDITDIGQARRDIAARHDRLLRQHQALSELTIPGLLEGADPHGSLRKLAAAAAATLGIARVGIWRVAATADAIRCVEQYAADRTGPCQAEIRAASCPEYFAAMLRDQIIDASDAMTDPRTRELRDSYLHPHGVGAMLDVPLHVGGKTVGVVCHEHLGGPREWTPEDRSFALSVANLASLVLEVYERRRLEEALARTVDTHEALLQTAPVAVFTVDAERRVTTWNRKAEELTGYSASEVKGNPCPFLAQDACRGHCALLDEGTGKAAVHNNRCVIRHHDGREIPLLKSAALAYDREGRRIGSIEVFQEASSGDTVTRTS